MIVFAIQNVIKDPPFTRLDLLCCRNLMIYLEPELQNRLLVAFHYALKPGGVLVLQTQRVLGDERFKSWRYRHDPTHIVFFAEASFRALAARWQADLCFPHTDVAVFTKP